MAMIRWTQREWQQIAGRLVVGGVDPSLHGWRGEVMRAMKGVLPKDRWRDASCLNNAKQILVPLMKQTVKTEEPVVRPAEIHPVTLRDSPLEELLVELARRVARLLAPSMVEQDVLKQFRFLEEKFKDSPPVDRGFYPPPMSKQEDCEEAMRPPRILIVGPRNGQQEELTKAHPKLRLSFVASEDRPGLINKMADICDEIVVWTNFVNHQHTAHAKSSGRPMVLISGGLSSLHARLSDWDKLA